MSARSNRSSSPTRPKGIRYFLAGLALIFSFWQPCLAELPEIQARSAYVFNFIKFIDWPSYAVRYGDTLRLCVMGDSELQASLTTLDGRKVGSYVLSMASGVAPSSCHVLYIGNKEQHRLVPLLKSLGNSPVLTISDIPGFAERGGCIGLLNRSDKMLFEVNLASTRKAGLQLSSQMLNLAVNIFGK